MDMVICPNCGASINVIPGRDKCFCGKCGNQIPLSTPAPAPVYNPVQPEITPVYQAPQVNPEITPPVYAPAQPEPVAPYEMQNQLPAFDVSAESVASEPKKSKKKTALIVLISLLAVIIACVVVFFTVIMPRLQISKLEFEEDKATINLNDKYTIEYKVNPTKYYFDEITWSSADETKVKVDQNGVITAVDVTKSGKKNTPVEITAKSKKNGKTASILITVEVELKSLELTNKAVTLEIGKTAVTAAIYNPENATDKKIEWESSDKKVATVKDGLITAVGEGTCKITAKSENGLKAECKVTVELPKPESFLVGNWKSDVLFDNSADDYSYITGYSSLTIYEDKTGVMTIGDETEKIRWSYYQTKSGNYYYKITDSTGYTCYAIYFTSGDLNGYLALYITDNYTILYETSNTVL